MSFNEMTNIFIFVEVEDNDLSRISSSLHVVLNEIVGSEEEVLIRRVTTNLHDDIVRMELKSSRSFKTIPYYSGSKAEGLRFKSSDEDWMLVNASIKVIQSGSFTAMRAYLIMDNIMTKPGFTLLKLIGSDDTEIVQPDSNDSPSPIVNMLNGRYVSSKIWRESLPGASTVRSPFRQFTHGPCLSYESCGTEYDNAYCLKCDFWPDIARPCIQRIYQSEWPPSDIVRSIVKDGVLFVPIGAKESVFIDEEWRMSFSLAEKKLIHAMNHTQFLCYALLKVFLKEAVDSNTEVKDLLCSYFLKTALFWEIISSPYNWKPSSLLSCFWKCFCRLLHWVSNSYCPNFFIPENNMFEGKIEGPNRDKLLQYLTALYHEGYKCLLRCPSLTSKTNMIRVLQERALIVEKPVCKARIACTAIREVMKSCPVFAMSLGSKDNLCLLLHHCLYAANNSLEQFLTRNWLYESLTQLCMSRSSKALCHEESNQKHYKNQMRSMRVLDRCRGDSVCHYLYQAISCYNIEKYDHTLKLVQKAKEAIFKQGSICMISEISIDQYRNAGGNDLPIETVMRNFVVGELRHHNIPELFIEAQCSKHLGYTKIPRVPPAICALFLQYLCHGKLGQRQRRDDALYELFLITQYDNNHLYDEHVYSTSLQILGICQQMSGDNRSAFHSYLQALRNTPSCCKLSTCIRLGIILAKYFCWKKLRNFETKFSWHLKKWQKETCS